MKITDKPLTLFQATTILEQPVALTLTRRVRQRIKRSHQVLLDTLATGKRFYGVNTGFGGLQEQTIEAQDLQQLQKNLLLSHACGVGDPLPLAITRLVFFLKIYHLAQGYSGVSESLLDYLLVLLNHDVLPYLPAQGSVGASGDLAPLAHLGLLTQGIGAVYYQGRTRSAQSVLKALALQPYPLKVKEGLALINGTEVTAALCLDAVRRAARLIDWALAAGSLSLVAFSGHLEAFRSEIHDLSFSEEQQDCAARIRDWCAGSRYQQPVSMRPQDPYSLRCQAQVMGAVVAQQRFAEQQILQAANAISDNPLVIAEQREILSGGNFHAAQLAMAADNLAIALAEIGTLVERRIALLLNPTQSNLPAFLSPQPGLHSGCMQLQVTAAALASENKSKAHPASVDSIPTSADQEDHVSMGTFAARRLQSMVDNAATIIAIELFVAAQAVEWREALEIAGRLKRLHQAIRTHVKPLTQDRILSSDIETLRSWMLRMNAAML